MYISSTGISGSVYLSKNGSIYSVFFGNLSFQSYIYLFSIFFWSFIFPTLLLFIQPFLVNALLIWLCVNFITDINPQVDGFSWKKWGIFLCYYFAGCLMAQWLVFWVARDLTGSSEYYWENKHTMIRASYRDWLVFTQGDVSYRDWSVFTQGERKVSYLFVQKFHVSLHKNKENCIPLSKSSFSCI